MNKMENETAKHIDISIKTKKILMDAGLDVAMATYTTGTSGQEYMRIEEKSGETFWSIRNYSSEIPKRGTWVKAPDIVAYKDGNVKLVIEIKWGFTKLFKKSDIWSFLQPPESIKMMNMIDQSKSCRISGPYVENGNRVEPGKPFNLTCDGNTKYILLSDFSSLHQNSLSEFEEIMAAFNASPMKDKLILVDIEKDIAGIPSLKSYIEQWGRR